MSALSCASLYRELWIRAVPRCNLTDLLAFNNIEDFLQIKPERQSEERGVVRRVYGMKYR